jgi:hypothetical protein
MAASIPLAEIDVGTFLKLTQYDPILPNDPNPNIMYGKVESVNTTPYRRMNRNVLGSVTLAYGKKHIYEPDEDPPYDRYKFTRPELFVVYTENNPYIEKISEDEYNQIVPTNMAGGKRKSRKSKKSRKSRKSRKSKKRSTCVYTKRR